MPKYANMVYNGFWFAPEREMLQAAIDQTQAVVNGKVRLKFYRFHFIRGCCLHINKTFTKNIGLQCYLSEIYQLTNALHMIIWRT
jgi:argininosuccinate synthase